MRQSARTIEQATDVGKWLLVSLLVMLNLPIVFAVITRMDLYSLYSLRSLEWVLSLYGVYALVAMALAIGIVTAGLAYALYKQLHKNCSGAVLKGWSAFYCHLLTIGLPMAIAMLPGLLLVANQGKTYFLIVGPLLAGGLGVIAACADERINISPDMARLYFVAAVFAMGGLVGLTVQWTFSLYGAEQIVPTDNSLWQWQINWNTLGYPASEFAQRQRDSMLIFAIMTSVYMVIVGIRMLVAFSGRMHGEEDEGQKEDDALSLIGLFGLALGFRRRESGESEEDKEIVSAPALPAYPPLPEWGVEVLKRLEWREGDAADYFVVFDGEKEVGITVRQYDNLLIDKDIILSEADLLVNRAMLDAFSKIEGSWERVHFRARRGTEREPSGPFSLLCVHAQNPRHRFEHHDLDRLLKDEMEGSGTINVAEVRNALKERKVTLDDGSEVDAIPLEYDPEDRGGTSFISDGVKVCYTYRNNNR